MGIKNSKPTRRSGFKQGYFSCSSPEKYIGDVTNIIYRSSWELRFMNYCDTNPKVLKWSSEPENFAVPYFHPIVEKVQNYYIDFLIQTEVDGVPKINLVEIKPKSQLPEEYGGKRPILEGERWTLKKAKEYNRKLETYIVNKSKFKAATEFAESKGWGFAILTEEDLFTKWKENKNKNGAS
jgi:hypothetical protein